MKKIMNKVNMAIIAVMVSVPAFAAETKPTTVSKEICDLIGELQNVFHTLRVLAFVGAGFLIAGWAWGWINAGDVKKDDIKDKGTGLIVGFAMLFAIGLVIGLVMNGKITGCDKLTGGW